jgi:hypothetical protein
MKKPPEARIKRLTFEAAGRFPRGQFQDFVYARPREAGGPGGKCGEPVHYDLSVLCNITAVLSDCHVE